MTEDLEALVGELVPGAALTRADKHPLVTSETKLHAMVLVSLVQSAGELQKRLDAFVRPFDLTMPRMAVLLHLFFSEQPLQPSQLGARLLVTRGNMTGLIDGLVQDGLVERTQQAGDRRVHDLVLTKAGQALVEEYLPHHRRALQAFTAGLEPEEERTLVRLLHKMRSGIAPLETPVRER